MARCELCKGSNLAPYVNGEFLKDSMVIASGEKIEYRSCPNLKEVAVDEITHERCQWCHGSGKREAIIDGVGYQWNEPCPYCVGSGVKHIITTRIEMKHESEVMPTMPLKTE